jgi:hypothetical protein
MGRLVCPLPGGRILFDDRPIGKGGPLPHCRNRHRSGAGGCLFSEMWVMDNLRIGAHPERARAL